MKKKTLITKKFGITALCSGLLGSAIIFAGCGSSDSATQTENAATTTESSAQTTHSASETEEKNVKLQVVDKNGNTSEYEEDTDAEFLRDVLDEISDDSDFTYSGTDSEFGIMIDTVNGERADYTLDGAYWSIYVNDEYANFGADQQPVADGDTFALKYEKAN